MPPPILGASMNKITVNFTPCSPAPPLGYNVRWRVAGTLDSYTNAGNFFISPAVFYDTTNPAGTDYEGLIRSDLGTDIDCTNIYWNTPTESKTPPEPTTGNIIVDDCGKGTEIQTMRFNGIVIPSSYFISEGESEEGTITNPSLLGTLEIDVVGHSGTENERIEVEDSNGNHQCQTMYGNNTYTFVLFDAVEGEGFTVHIKCGDVCP